MRFRSCVVAIVLLSAVAFPAFTGAADTVLLEEMTWTELRDAVQAGKTTVIVPIGGTEQNGPHMALGKHNVRVKFLSEKIARALDNAVVAPVMAYVPEGRVKPPSGHMRFPGTITVPDDVFQKILESAVRSLEAHGFRDIVLLGDHGSTQAGEKAVAARLNREWAATPVRVHAVEEYYRAADTAFARLLGQRSYRDAEIGRHAGLTDTSLMLAIDPRMVRTTLMRPGTGLDGGNGVDGDPTRATADLGRLGVDLIVQHTVDAIRKSVTRRER
jgi:creatinine amidohydrolase